MANVSTAQILHLKNKGSIAEIPFGPALFLTPFNISFAVVALLGNSLITVSLQRVSSFHPSTRLLLRCLAVTDLCVALITQPIHVSSLFKGISGINLAMFDVARKISYVFTFLLCEVSIFTSTALSIDRFLALHLGLSYRTIVTLKRVCFVLICFCVLGISNGLMFITLGKEIALIVSVVLSVLSVFVSIFSYKKIFFSLRQRQVGVQVRRGGGRMTALNIAKYKETVSSVQVVQLAFLACFLPVIVVASLEAFGKGNKIAWNLNVSLLFFNSALNPILYTWKIKAMRQAVKDTMRRIQCH